MKTQKEILAMLDERLAKCSKEILEINKKRKLFSENTTSDTELSFKEGEIESLLQMFGEFNKEEYEDEKNSSVKIRIRFNESKNSWEAWFAGEEEKTIGKRGEHWPIVVGLLLQEDSKQRVEIRAVSYS